MPLPERVIIDTVAFQALVADNCSLHQIAKHTYERLIDREQELWTTSYILMYMIKSLQEHKGPESTNTFMESIQDIIHIFWIEGTIYNDAWEQMQQGHTSGLSIIDWTTANVTRRLRAYMFTFNSSFSDIGIPILPRRS